MAKAKKLSPKEIALLAVAAGFAWSKLGLGAAVTEIAPQVVKPWEYERPDCGPGERVAWNGSKYVCVPRL